MGGAAIKVLLLELLCTYMSPCAEVHLVKTRGFPNYLSKPTISAGLQHLRLIRSEEEEKT